MQAVRVEVLRLVRSESPGWVECRLVDSAGTEWLFVEKVPMVLHDDVAHLAFLPRPGILACVRRDEDGDVATIETHVESTNGQSVFQVLATKLLEM